MAVCARHCKKSLLNAVVSGARETSSSNSFGRAVSSISPTHAIRPSPLICTRAIATSSSCADNIIFGRIQSRQYCGFANNKTFGATSFTRHYASESEEDFSRGYGGPIQTPVIDWRDKHEIDFKTFAKMMDEGRIQLIDVREPFEIESAGGIDQSINIPFVHFRTALLLSPDEFTKKYNAKQPTKEDDDIVIMDLRGNRSEAAIRICYELGFTKANRFPGGFREWAAKNDLPVPPTYYEHGIPRDHWTNLKYDDLRMMIKRDDVYVIDVREPWEVVEEGSITNALNIPMGYVEYALNMDEADFERQYARRKPGKMDDIGFISWKGLRSAGCQLLAQELGYQKACHFRGGMEKFNSKKQKAERPWATDFPLPKS